MLCKALLIAVLSIFASLAVTSPVLAQRNLDLNLCEGVLKIPGDFTSRPTIDESILACTRVIDRGDSETASIRSRAYEQRGRLHESTGDIDQAIFDFSNGPEPSFLSRCAAYEMKGDLDRAISDCNEAVRVYSHRGGAGSALELRGKLYFIIGDYAAAASDLSQSTIYADTLDPALWRYVAHERAEEIGAPLSLPVAMSAVEELDTDVAMLERHEGFRFVELFLGGTQWDETKKPIMPTRCDTLFFTGEFHLLKGREPEAKRYLEQAITVCGRTRPELDQYLAARAELSRIKDILQYRPEQLHRRDQEEHRRTEEFERVVQTQTQVIEYTSSRPGDRMAAYNLRGEAYLAHGELTHAIADYTEAIRLDATNVEALKNRCTAYAMKGDIDPAVTDCAAAAGLEPDKTQSVMRRGQLHFIAGDYATAASEFSQAVEHKPDDIFALLWRDLANRRSWKPSNFELDKSNLKISHCSALSAGNSESFSKCMNDPVPPGPPLHFCQQQFYLGEQYILTTMRPYAFAAFRKATASGCPKNTYEFLGAQAELKRIDQVIQERNRQIARQLQERDDQTTRFKQLLATTRSEAGSIVFEYEYP